MVKFEDIKRQFSVIFHCKFEHINKKKLIIWDFMVKLEHIQNAL